jgi:putative restriction endonuclease
MANLSKPELLYKIVEAISDSGWNVLYISDRHPFKLNIYRDKESYLLKIYIWNITHGGGFKRPTNEYRIQVKVPYFEPETNYKILILGWWDEGNVFAGFDFEKHTQEIGWSASFQVKREALEKAYFNGIASSDKENKEIAIAFKPEFLVDYVKNLKELHSFGESAKDLSIFEKIVADNEIEINDETLQKISKPRRITVQTVSRKLRESSFKSRILTAYSFKCAFCDLQLKLIDAAHIVPVADEESTDETSNGIALCALHHRAFDRALVTFDEKYRILSNDQKIQQLIEIKQDGKIDEFISQLKPLINFPPAINDRPNKDYILKANKIRGWF